MTFFNDDELVDYIRNCVPLADDAGLAQLVLPRPSVKARPEGIGLNLPPQAKSKNHPTTPDDQCPEEEWYLYERLLENFVLEGEGQNDMTSHTIDAELRSWYAELEETTSGPPAETSAARGGAVNGVEESRRLEFVPAFTSTEDFLCPSTSLASRLVESTPIEQRTIPFAEYAKFEAIGCGDDRDSRRFTIIFPFPNGAEQGKQQGNVCALQIRINSSAKMGDLIGLACYTYAKNQQRMPPCELPGNYSLYHAEDNLLDYDAELPPQDRHKLVSECGFPVLAMIPNEQRPETQRSRYKINVYLTDGRRFSFEVESLDIPLKWVHEMALMRKRSEDNNHNSNSNGKEKEKGRNNQQQQQIIELEYHMEALNQPGVQLSLANTVSSAASFDFVLIRVNSARGSAIKPLSPAEAAAEEMAVDNHRHHKNNKGLGRIASMPIINEDHLLAVGNGNGGGGGFSSGYATIHNIKLTGSRHRSPHQQQKMTTSFSSVFSDYGGGGLDAANAENDELIVGPTKRQQQHVEIGAGGLLAEYSGVERVHRIKPKAPVKLLIREGCIELAPAKTDGGRGARTTKKWGPSRSSKNNDLATSNENNNSRGGEGEHHQSSKGTKRIPWDRVCAVELVKKSNPRRSALRLTTLQPTPPHPTRGDLIVYGDDSHHHPSAAVVDQLCADEGAVWKSIMLEAEADSIWRIVAELNQLLGIRNSVAAQVYKCSLGGARKPAAAARESRLLLLFEAEEVSSSTYYSQSHQSQSGSGQKWTTNDTISWQRQRSAESSSQREEEDNFNGCGRSDSSKSKKSSSRFFSRIFR